MSKCTKQAPPDVPEEQTDARDSIVGTYSGIQIHTYYDPGSPSFANDTSAATVILSKGSGKSVIYMEYSTLGGVYHYDYENGNFTGHEQFHYPHLQVNSDTLTSSYQPGLGPSWYAFHAVKQ